MRLEIFLVIVLLAGAFTQELDEEVQVQPVKIRNSNAKDVDTFAGHINIEKENELNKNIINVLLAILKKRNELE